MRHLSRLLPLALLLSSLGCASDEASGPDCVDGSCDELLSTQDWIDAANVFWDGGTFLYDEFETCPCLREENPEQPPGWEGIMTYGGPNPGVCKKVGIDVTILDYDGTTRLSDSAVRFDYLLPSGVSRIQMRTGPLGQALGMCVPLMECGQGLESGLYASDTSEDYRACAREAFASCETQGVNDYCREPVAQTDAAGQVHFDGQMIGTAVVDVSHPESEHLVSGEFQVQEGMDAVTLQVYKEEGFEPGEFLYYLDYSF